MSRKDSNWLSGSGKLVNRANDISAYLAALLILFLTVLVTYSIAARHFQFAYPIWQTQVSEYIILWSTFLGAAWLLRKGGHVKVDFLLTRLNPRARVVLAVIETVIGTACSLVLVLFGAYVTWDLWQRGIIDVRAIDVPKFSVMIVIPLGSLLLFIESVRALYRASSDLKKNLRKLET